MKHLPLYLFFLILAGCNASLFEYNSDAPFTLAQKPPQINKKDIQTIYFYSGKQIELKQFNKLHKEKSVEKITYHITDNADSLAKYAIRTKYLSIAYVKD